MIEVAVIDIGIGNIDSVLRALETCNGNPYLAASGDDIRAASHLVLPGVGAFSAGMEKLQRSGLLPALEESVHERQIPILGICLGMQLLASAGTEGGQRSPGLGWIAGEVRRLAPRDAERVPHVGWNEVQVEESSPCADWIPEPRDFYFTHSFCFIPAEGHHRAGTTPYAGDFCSLVHSGNIFGAQFHPEKSQQAGRDFLQGFLSC